MARRFARIKEMKERGYFNDRMAANRAVARGFPAPYELGPNTIAWDLDEVDEYDRTRPRRRPGCGIRKPAAAAEPAPQIEEAHAE